MNASVSKILSLHIPTLLPPGSSELMLLSHGTQAAAMLGLGLLYMNSQHRRMSEVMLGELFAIKNATPSTMTTRLDGADPAESAAECYSLAAGFALGLVALGQGTSSRSLSDLRLLDALTETMHASDGSKAANHGSPMDMLGRLNIAPRSSRSLGSGGNMGNVSDLGAIAALGLIFLGTNYHPAAQRLALPTTTYEIRSIDPFLLLWKTLMRSLIMLDSISPTPAWVETNVPQWMPAQLPADLCRARLHVVTAACFAIGLKYAGTEDYSAHTTILTYFDEVEAAASRPALGYEPSLTRASAQACLDIMCISAALVMAGSGDVATMQRLRAFHGVSASRTYGTHMASNLALGILFIGGGARFTLSNSVESIALLLIAFFPRFPQHYSDNREHLQAWRHLWALCVKPRCLVARDVTNGRMCLEATISLVSRDTSGESRTLSLVPPVLFPSLDRVASVHVWAPGYLPITLDLEINPDVGHLLSRRRIIYMQPSEHFPSLGTTLGGMGLTSLSKYHVWLANVQCLVTGACEQLEAAVSTRPESGEHSQTPPFSAIQAIQRLRICARYSHSCLTSRNSYSGDSAARNWAEATYLAWLATRDTVLRLGRLDACRQMIAAHWAAGQISPDASRSSRLFAVVGLMNAALDIPRPADAMELAKVVPASSLVDHFLGVK
ncbi:Anaphase-promoting complex subunit 1 [Kickxella alabastrina]|nr:Anaphase-promoting complex subunit 1 [Kickxella alabastrina]